jgi:hypothetical protein
MIVFSGLPSLTRLDQVSKHLPMLVLTLCLTALGIGIHRKAARAVAPPIFDPMSYYTKGAMVWKEWSNGRLVNPLNVEPTSRPPGTMLLTSPLGFSPDFRAFFFRSTYIPVVVFVIAFWVRAESQVRRPRQRWANLAGALMLASLPMFYQFERNPNFTFTADWGHMDCFLGALAALATSLLMVSVRRCSIALAAMGVFLGALTLFVKPAGLALLPIFCFLWATELIAMHWPLRAKLRGNRMLKRYSIWTASLLVLTFAAVTAESFGSEYLSKANLAFGYNGQKIVIDMYKSVPLRSLISPQIQASLGWHWLCASIVAALLLLGGMAVRLSRRSMRLEEFRFLAALATLGLGVVWWVEFAGPAQIRYLYPFLTIFLVVLLPGILAVADVALPRWARRGLAIVCVAPMGVIVALLFMDAPPLKAQWLAGVNLTSGQFSQEVRMGDLLVDQARQQGRSLKVYVIPPDQRPAVVEAEGIQFSLSHPDAPTFQTQRPNDWAHPILIRRVEFVQADYLLIDPVRDADRLRALLTQPVVDDPAIESDVFSAWLTQAAGEQGLEVLSESDLRLIRVIDHAKLDQAFGRLIPKHHWRDLFYAENNAPVILTRDALLSAAERSVPGGRDVRFGGRFLLHGAALTPSGEGLQMELVWESLAEQPLKYFVFVHLIDPSGKMLAQADYEQAPGARTTPRVAKAGEIWRDIVPLSADRLKGASGIGFGIWEPPGTFLAPDRGDRDWDNQRLILRVPRDSRQSGPAASAHYEGRLEYAGCDGISGWAWNALAPNVPIGVRILSDGNPLMTLTADRPRPDLKAAGKGSGAHAFFSDMPPVLKDGRPHSVAAKTGDSEFELPNSPQHVTCR